jgi:3-oxoacyl-[acyl-carrier-protein] synthase-3
VKTAIRSAITAVAHYVPEKKLTNFDLEKMVDTSDEWIRTRTGISERRILENGKASSDMAFMATKRLLEKRGISASEIEVIIFATVTPDMLFPASACLLQDKIGAKNAWGFDLSAACSGFVFALITGASLVESGRFKKVLVVGADKMSSIVDYSDRNICVLFGDAAGAVLLEPSTNNELGIIDSILKVDGSGAPYLYMSGGGSLNPPTHETVDKKMHYIFQDGKTVFKFAVAGMADVSAEILEKNHLIGKDVALFVPHQANLRIIDASAKRMGLEPHQVAINIDKYGNTTAATIPMCLSEAVEQNRLKKGDNVVLASFGAGFTWGSIFLRWAY